MNKRELADKLAKQAHKSRAKAADDVDNLVYGILKDLKQTEKKPETPSEAVAPKPPAAAPRKEKP